MSTVVAIGISHRSAPLSLLERLSLEESNLEKYLHDLISRDHITEAVVISTCNRTEIFVTAEKFHGAFRDLRDFFSDVTFLPPEDFADNLEVSHDADAVTHLFKVAAGLESVVIGEHEILGQVRDAWDSAREAGACGPTLNLLFRHALEAGKRARNETAISRHVTSVSHAAVIMADEHLAEHRDGGISGAVVAVVGAGSMARGVVDFSASRAAASVAVLNRTVERAAELASDAHAWGTLNDLAHHLVVADVVFCATSAPGGIIGLDLVEAAVQQRAGRPLLLVDIAVPRDVAPEVAELNDVTLLDMDGLSAFAEIGLSKRREEIPAVEKIVNEEVDRYLSASSARSVTPLIVDMRERAETLVTEELARFGSKLDSMETAERETVEVMVRSVVAKMLHEPTVALKESAGTPRGERLVGSLRELFDL